MAWREIATEDGVWRVEPAAERRAYAESWQLMLSFRSAQGDRDPARFWAPYPLESPSRNSLFVAADRIGDDELRALLAEFVG